MNDITHQCIILSSYEEFITSNETWNHFIRQLEYASKTSKNEACDCTEIYTENISHFEILKCKKQELKDTVEYLF